MEMSSAGVLSDTEVGLRVELGGEVISFVSLVLQPTRNSPWEWS